MHKEGGRVFERTDGVCKVDGSAVCGWFGFWPVFSYLFVKTEGIRGREGGRGTHVVVAAAGVSQTAAEVTLVGKVLCFSFSWTDMYTESLLRFIFGQHCSGGGVFFRI